jgi:pilus assembly protein CpaE
MDALSSPPAILLIGPDAAALGEIAGALGPSRAVTFTCLPEPLETAARRPEIEGAAAVVVELDPKRREGLVALQGLCQRLWDRAPVIVVTGELDDALVRWLLQVRVADVLRKPVDPKEVLRACIKALQASSGLPGETGQILTFLPAAGGVGTTTLAIESAMILHRASGKEGDQTCLVDLDFTSGACADYLDLEPRLDLDEIGPHPERLDLQLLEVMLSRHATGLTLVAARGKPGRPSGLAASTVLQLLDLVSQRFANVVIDLPRAWDAWTDEVLTASNRLFVVTDMTVPGLRLGRRLAASLTERLPDAKPRVIVNRFEQQLLFGTGLRRADVERALEGFLEGTVSNNYKLVREAIDRGTPLEQIKAGSNVSTDLKRLVLGGAAADDSAVLLRKSA